MVLRHETLNDFHFKDGCMALGYMAVIRRS